MIRHAALREEVTVFLRSSGATINRYGDPVLEEDSGTPLRAAVEPLDATEEEIDRDTRVSRYRLLVSPLSEIDGLARIEWRGLSLEVIGEPQPLTAKGQVHHYEIEARTIKG